MKASPGGFTLIEVLIGMTLFSLVLVLIFSGLHSISRSWRAANLQAEDNDNYRLVMSFIRRQLSQARPILYLDGEDNPVIFDGNNDNLRLVTPLPSHRGGYGLYLVSFYINENTLELSYQPLFTLKDWPGIEHYKSNRTALINNVTDLNFNYFGYAEDSKTARWHDSWNSRKQLPMLVRVKLLNDDMEEWPEQIIHIPTNIEQNQPQLTLIRNTSRQ